MNELRMLHDHERQELIRDMSHIKDYDQREAFSSERNKINKKEYNFDSLDRNDDLEPDL